MSEHEIPEAAVEAAAVAYATELEMTGQLPWEDLPAERKESRFRWMQAALEAAAPHMLAWAWDEGRVVGMMDPHRIEQSIKLNAPEFAQVANPYRNHPVIPEAAVEA